MDSDRKFTFWTALTAIGVLLIVFSVAVVRFDDAKSVISVLGAITGLLGTLVGYVAGQTGKQDAEDRASTAEKKVNVVLGMAESNLLNRAREAHPGVF